LEVELVVIVSVILDVVIVDCKYDVLVYEYLVVEVHDGNNHIVPAIGDILAFIRNDLLFDAWVSTQIKQFVLPVVRIDVAEDLDGVVHLRADLHDGPMILFQTEVIQFHLELHNEVHTLSLYILLPGHIFVVHWDPLVVCLLVGQLFALGNPLVEWGYILLQA